MYVLNECFKYKFRDSSGGQASPQKVCDENIFFAMQQDHLHNGMVTIEVANHSKGKGHHEMHPCVRHNLD